MSLKKKLPEILIFAFLLLFVGALLLAKEFELFLPGGPGRGQGGKEGAGRQEAEAEKEEQREEESPAEPAPRPGDRRLARRVGRLAAELLGPAAAPPAAGGAAPSPPPGESSPDPPADPLAGVEEEAGEVLLARLGKKAVELGKSAPPPPLDLAALFGRAARDLARLPGDRLLRQEAAVRRRRVELGCDRRREVGPGERLRVPGFLVDTAEGFFLVPSLWRIRHGLPPRRDELLQVRLDPAVAGIPGLSYRPVVVEGTFFHPGDPGINAGLDARTDRGGVKPLD